VKIPVNATNQSHWFHNGKNARKFPLAMNSWIVEILNMIKFNTQIWNNYPNLNMAFSLITIDYGIFAF